MKYNKLRKKKKEAKRKKTPPSTNRENRIYLIRKKAEVPLPPASSKYYGIPGVWDEFEWPCSFKKGNTYLYYHLCQINCADILKHDVNNRLPKTGILYFFFDDEQYKGHVEYYNGDLSTLKNYKNVLGHLPAPSDYPESTLEFSRNEGFSCYEYLLGTPDCMNEPGARYWKSPDRWQLLLQTNAFIGGDILYFIDKQDLINKDFSNVWVDIVYD